MKIQLNGKEVDAESVSFVPFAEPWCEYHLEDGSILRFRATATVIFKTPDTAPNGEPVYAVNHAVQVAFIGKK